MTSYKAKGDVNGVERVEPITQQDAQDVKAAARTAGATKNITITTVTRAANNTVHESNTTYFQVPDDVFNRVMLRATATQ